jgi:hypothetical protein
MPRGTSGAAVATAPQESASTAVMIPQDVRNDLLRAQQEEMGDNARLAQVKVMAAGAGLFEFKDGSIEPTRAFKGIVLNSHDRNVLWDRAFGDEAAPPAAGQDAGEQNLPACSSGNGKQGIPRAGFVHAALQRAGSTPVAATGNEVIECASCPYNQFGTGRMFNPRGNERGKAVTNQKSVYVLLEGRETPVEVVLTPSSLQAYQDYLGGLLNQGIPVQAVVTEFAQEVKQRAGSNLRWGVVVFRQGEFVSGDRFAEVLTARNRFARQIMPTEILVEATVDDATTHVAGEGRLPTDDSEEIPF